MLPLLSHVTPCYPLLPLLPLLPHVTLTREIKIHVYSIRQTANVSGEFLRIENKQLKKVQNDSCGQN